MAKKWFILCMTVALVALFMGGCGKEPSAEANKKIAVVVSTLNNPWFVVLKDAAKAKAEELGYDVDVFDSQNSPVVEAGHFDTIVDGKYAAVLFNPTDAEGSIASVKRARDAGIPTFCMDREISANDVAISQVLCRYFTDAADAQTCDQAGEGLGFRFLDSRKQVIRFLFAKTFQFQ